jgi:hypothetical protein
MQAPGAYQKLVEAIEVAGEISQTEAKRVADLYLSKAIRAVKLDGVDGSIKLAHGGFMEKAVIRRALSGL